MPRWLLAKDQYSMEARLAIGKLRGLTDDNDVQVSGYRRTTNLPYPPPPPQFHLFWSPPLLPVVVADFGRARLNA